MNEFVAFVFASTPWVLAFLIPLAIVTWLTVGAQANVLWVAMYFTLIFYFPNASWGLLDQSDNSSFYNRATGTFYFSAINIFLFGLVAQAFMARRFSRPLTIENNLRIPALLFWIILVINVIVGVFQGSTRWFEIVGYSGLLNVANMMFVFYVLASCLRSDRDLDLLINLLLFCAATRGIWGAVRFAAMGGDPANFYSNFQQIDVKLTFFDINDSLIATVAVFIASWRLLTGQCKSPAAKWLHLGIVILELFIVFFSYRRTAWGGLAMAAVLLAGCQRSVIRNNLFILYGCVGIPAIALKLAQRSGQNSKGLSFLEKALPDIVSGGQISFTTGRFAELYAAFLSVKESPIWGLGAWGRYDGFRFSELAWHRGDFSWMHSAVLHILLKTGLVGFAIMIAVLVGFFLHAARNRKALSEKHRGIMLAGAAGILFMLPTWLFGTPIIEYRTMQLLGFSLALPYLAVVAAKAVKE